MQALCRSSSTHRSSRRCHSHSSSLVACACCCFFFFFSFFFSPLSFRRDCCSDLSEQRLRLQHGGGGGRRTLGGRPVHSGHVWLADWRIADGSAVRRSDKQSTALSSWSSSLCTRMNGRDGQSFVWL